ncbi:carbohydrate ABC transporter permease [Paenibacillus hexagrammi]|uniref:Carbohydrate ABC transporter permease n=1 Tax=Paenibacillus hexagrammi TaxID=2908839 RepID=A0ABY3SGD1_9BACL|nr:carbohydrate ABC transporter permease [Paenibacillus sp. YPD9-1]UJF32518.1 carbohydrate ABC transporter permease [Paenibacillus sp. YPD9-1]
MKKLGHMAGHILMVIVALLFLTPVVWMILLSLKAEGSSWFQSSGFLGLNLTLSNYSKVLSQAPIFGWMGNSLIVACSSTLLILVFASMAAFTLSRNPFPGSKVLFFLFLSGMMIPSEATLIPLYIQMKDMGLIGSLESLILPAAAAPLGIFVMKQFFDGLPKEMEEAARIDGAGAFRIWWNIFLPLSRPAMSALGIFSFIGAWNDYLWPLVSISNKAYMTITLGLPSFQSAYLQQYSLPMTANALATIPVLIVFILFQKHIIKGIAFTGGKEE